MPRRDRSDSGEPPTPRVPHGYQPVVVWPRQASEGWGRHCAQSPDGAVLTCLGYAAGRAATCLLGRATWQKQRISCKRPCLMPCATYPTSRCGTSTRCALTRSKRFETACVHDEIKRASRHPPATALSEDTCSELASPVDCAIAREDIWRCRAVLARLRPADRRRILLALSGDRSLRELATRSGKSSSDAARVALSRAVRRLAKEMEETRLVSGAQARSSVPSSKTPGPAACWGGRKRGEQRWFGATSAGEREASISRLHRAAPTLRVGESLLAPPRCCANPSRCVFPRTRRSGQGNAATVRRPPRPRPRPRARCLSFPGSVRRHSG